MPHRPLAAFALAALLIPAGHAATPAASPKPAPPWQGKLSPCTLPEGGGKAFCGSYEVFENREARSGRKIRLKIVIADFIERGSTQGLDLSCIKAAPPEPFITSIAKLPKGR